MPFQLKTAEKVVLWLYCTIAIVFVFLSWVTMDYPLYYNLYCALSAAAAIGVTYSGKLSHTMQMYTMASLFLLMNTLYGTIYGSVGIIQDAFLAIAAICSLYFCVRLNLFILCYTVGFYVFCACFYMDTLISTLSTPKELSVRLIVLILSQMILTALVSFINRAQQTLVDKNTSFMELLRIVEIKKRDAVAASKTKADFLASMSHEIRTPMNAIVGMTEMILRENLSSTVRENARNIKSAGNSLLAIINDILDFSKIESGKMEIIPVNYQPTSILNDLVNIISVRLVEKNLELIVSLDPDLPHELIGDEIRLRQILLNLLNNAAKFTSAGHISLSISHQMENGVARLTCSVSDTGNGIKEENIPHLFESFSRFDTRLNRTVEGTGLGLSICKNLLDLMDGTISVESVYGKGTTFRFTLPQEIADPTPVASLPKRDDYVVLVIDGSGLLRQAADADLTRLRVRHFLAADTNEMQTFSDETFTHLFVTKHIFDEHASEIRQFAKAAKIVVVIDKKQLPSDYQGVMILRQPLYSAVYASVLSDAPRPVYEADEFHESFIAPDARILVVDDNAVNLKVVKGLLEPYQMQVFTAVSGLDCLKLLETERYDLIFMDHMMPELDGIDTLRLIRKQPGPYFQSVPVIALTANAVSGVREMFFQEGFQDYVSKPIELAKLEKALKHHLPKEYIRKANTVRPTVEAPSDSISLPGVDIHRGLQSCGGQMQQYLELLKVVYEDGVKKCERLRGCAKEKDYTNYTIEAHALKSVAASIGAAELSALAKTHEFAGKEQQYAIIDDGYLALAEQYDALLQDIAALLKSRGWNLCSVEQSAAPQRIPTAEQTPIEKSVLSQTLDQLRTCIDEFDADEAVKLLDSLETCRISDEMFARLQKVRKFLDDFSYEEALSLLREGSRPTDTQTENPEQERRSNL